MPIKEGPKNHKQKNNPSEEIQSLLISPCKREEDNCKTVNLRDLSPFSPVLRTIKKSYDSHYLNLDLAMIETPNPKFDRPSLIEEVDAAAPQISKILVWEEDDEDFSHNLDIPSEQSP